MGKSTPLSSFVYDQNRYGEMTWKPSELRHALVFSFHVGGFYALVLGFLFVQAAMDPAKKSMGVVATVMCFGLVGGATLVDGDISMALSPNPPVIVWTILGTIGT